MPEKMVLARFCSYVGEQWRAAQQVYAEIEEVQYQFNEIYRQRLEAWQGALARTVPLLVTPESLPPGVAQSLLEIVDRERARLVEEIGRLQEQVTEKRSAADAAAAAAQAEVAALRQLNPRLDATEEEIKARCACLQAEIARLEAEIRATGLVSGLLRRRRLRRERDQQKRDLAEALSQLRAVRQQWVEERQRVEAEQTRLHQVWEAASVEAAELQSRLDYLQANLERLARENGAGQYLAGLQATPDVTEPLRRELAQVVELNRVKAEYEGGLRTVSEALGLLKGLAEGMERFGKSASMVLEEQRQYNLRELQVPVSDAVLAFHAVWPEFRAQVKDEKMLGTHPAEFSRRVHAIIESRLGEAAIAAMFESLGDGLTQATKAWG